MSTSSVAFPSNTICYEHMPVPSKAESLALQAEQEAKAYKLKSEASKSLDAKDRLSMAGVQTELANAPSPVAKVSELGQLIGNYINITA
ncbi:hypothetical protein [Undibacterium sp. Ren11W]|uniref:hypothetical protein n=1 Tax=Undibacterium sp. Ren11W TaxID=3413045 RepID=UPI003BF41762